MFYQLQTAYLKEYHLFFMRVNFMRYMFPLLY